LKAQDKILKKNRALVEKNLMKLNVFFDRLPELFEWYQPDGGCVGFPRYLGHEGVERFTKRLVEEVGIIMLPASIFRSDLGSVQNNRFRIGFGRSYFADALEGLQEYLRNRKI
jgi:aspartate/methionine/tyrosine aminotransferase